MDKNSEGKYLIQKRAANKSLPNMWAVTGGAVTAGEDSQLGMLREVEEELGLLVDASKAKVVFTHMNHRCFADIWLIEQDFDITLCELQEEEVSDCKWAEPDEIIKLCLDKKFVDYSYLDYFIKS